MATFSQLQTDVGQIIIDLPSTVTAQLPNFVRRAHRRLQELHNFEVMKAATALTSTTVNTHTLLPVPANFKEYRMRPYSVEADGTVDILDIAVDKSAVEQIFGSEDGGEASLDILAGPPRAILRTEPTDELGTTAWQIWPLADGLSLYANGEYRIRIPYWKFLATLSGSTDQDWLTNNAEEWITYQAAFYGYLNNQDPEGALPWGQKAADCWQQIMSLDKRLKLSANAGTLVPQPRVYGSRVAGITRRGWGWRYR